MKCGIVILNYNDYETTEKLLKMIWNYKSLEKIVIVDNHSTDNSYQELCRYQSEKIAVIRTKENGGYSRGNNIGIKYLIKNANVDIIAIANPDVEFEEEFVERIIKDFGFHKDYAIITGLQMNSEGEIASHPFWGEYTTGEHLIRQLFRLGPLRYVWKGGFDGNYVQRKLKLQKRFFQVGAVEGSLFFIRLKEFERIGLFDEGVFLYFEEDILAKKIRGIGKKIGVDSMIKYVHYGATTTQKVLDDNINRMHMFDSSVYYFNHYQSENKILKAINFLLCYLYRIQNGIVINIKKFIYKNKLI